MTGFTIPSSSTHRIDALWKASLRRRSSPTRGSAAFIIGIAGGKLRSDLPCIDWMLAGTWEFDVDSLH
jgi:hypothetical protein